MLEGYFSVTNDKLLNSFQLKKRPALGKAGSVYASVGLVPAEAMTSLGQTLLPTGTSPTESSLDCCLAVAVTCDPDRDKPDGNPRSKICLILEISPESLATKFHEEPNPEC